jgi:hypothetical protein
MWPVVEIVMMMVSSTSDGDFGDNSDNEVDWRALNKMYYV